MNAMLELLHEQLIDYSKDKFQKSVPAYQCKSCNNMISSGDYCSECSDNPSGRSKQQSTSDDIESLSMELYFNSDLGEDIDHNVFTQIYESGYVDAQQKRKIRMKCKNPDCEKGYVYSGPLESWKPCPDCNGTGGKPETITEMLKIIEDLRKSETKESIINRMVSVNGYQNKIDLLIKASFSPVCHYSKQYYGLGMEERYFYEIEVFLSGHWKKNSLYEAESNADDLRIQELKAKLSITESQLELSQDSLEYMIDKSSHRKDQNLIVFLLNCLGELSIENTELKQLKEVEDES